MDTIHIRPDGNISPLSAPIVQEGNVYRLTRDLYNTPIILERNHAVFDGSGYMLQGAQDDVALNITCSDVTIENVKAWNWEAGILGAYDNVTIQNCNLTGNSKGIAIYANEYNILSSYVAFNEWGIRVQGSDINIFGNHLVNNSIGIWISSYGGEFDGNTIAYNTVETYGQIAVETDKGGGFEVSHNNFVISRSNVPILQTAFPPTPGDDSEVVMQPWDNGAEGNYWSDYTTKYPNATEKDTTGIYDTAYVINIAPNLADRYPLVKQAEVPNVISPILSPIPTPSPPQSPSTSPSPSEPPSESPSKSPNVSLEPSPSTSSTELKTQTPQSQPDFTVELVFAITIIALAVTAILAIVVAGKKH